METPTETRKSCYGCKALKPLTEYGVNRAKKDGLSHLCKTCMKPVAAASRRRNGGYKHGLSKKRRQALIDRQGGVCAICGSPDFLVVDHDHSCCDKKHSCGTCIRGILCRYCNLALGYIKDDPKTALKMAAYLGK